MRRQEMNARPPARGLLALAFSAGWALVFAAAVLVGICEAGRYHESPMLSKLVAEGKLPPVEERLPQEPAVVVPYEKIGVYGGYDKPMNTISGQADVCNETQYMCYEPLLRFAPDGKTIVPNLATRWEMSHDAKSITLYLRKGMKWSDGVPVTMDDVLFAWEDVFMNKELSPLPPSAYMTAGEPMKVEIIDDHTFRLVFTEPYGAIPYFLTRSTTWLSLIQPKHYLKRYHPKYTPLADIMKIAKERGFQHWFNLFDDVNHTQRAINPQMPPDYPTLSPWHVVDVPSIGHTIMERNPYYWKVDPERNQLPYIDRIHEKYVGNPEARNLEFITGNIDFGGSYARFDNSPLFLSNQEKGHYSVYFWQENQGTRVAYYFNLTNKDLEKRKVFQDLRFRIALSHAINREEINRIVYYGKCVPKQDTVNRQCSYWESEFETAYVEYNPAKAEALLDEMGLRRKGKNGWRTLPSGRILVITLDAFFVEPYMKTAELVAAYWEAVGVLLSWRVVDSGFANLRVSGNEFDVVGYPNDNSNDVMVLNDPLYGVSYWAPLWSRWFRTQGQVGEEPPPQIKQLYAVWEEMRRTPDEAERVRLGKVLIHSQAENLWGIGTVGDTLCPIIVSHRLHNVPRYMKDLDGNILKGQLALWGWPWLATFLHHAEQFYLED
ncbi:MAG: ABC transporter substrate-binding protein [Planctomycetota bacterium]